MLAGPGRLPLPASLFRCDDREPTPCVLRVSAGRVSGCKHGGLSGSRHPRWPERASQRKGTLGGGLFPTCGLGDNRPPSSGRHFTDGPTSRGPPDPFPGQPCSAAPWLPGRPPVRVGVRGKGGPDGLPGGSACELVPATWEGARQQPGLARGVNRAGRTLVNNYRAALVSTDLPGT